LVLFAYLAGVTSRIEFSTAVIILPQRQTVLFAKQAANVDILCGGRLRLAMGVGWNDAEYEALGVDFHSRGKKLDEQIPLLRRLWLEDALTFDGRFHHIRGAGINPLPVQRPIPLWIGGLSDSAMRRAASIGDGWSPVFPGKEAPERIGIFHEAVVKAGRDPARVGFEIIVMSGATVGGPILSPEQSAAEFKAFRAAGASHGAVHTMGVGLKTLDAHLKYLEAYKIHTTK
jgi:probable F420-dependent oxidoreductase